MHLQKSHAVWLLPPLTISVNFDVHGNDGRNPHARADLTLLPLRAVRRGGVAIPCGFRPDHLLRRQGSRLDAGAHPLDRQRDAQAASARSKWLLGSACARLLCLLWGSLTAIGDSALPRLEPAASNVEHRPLYADTSTECALRLARACARGEYAELAGATVLNNHFDTDGVLAVWACLKPAEALRHSALL